MAGKSDYEPTIVVTIAPKSENQRVLEFPFSTESNTVSGSTVPSVAKTETEQAIGLATKLIDYLKDTFVAGEQKLVIKLTEEEKIDRGWFSHMDLSLGGKFEFPDGSWEAKIKGTPLKEKRTKETRMEVSLEKKENK
jgi:hypothetical protein